MSYVVIGAAIADLAQAGSAGPLAAFALALGIGAHALDETSRPATRGPYPRCRALGTRRGLDRAGDRGRSRSSGRVMAVARGVCRVRRVHRRRVQPRALRRSVPLRPCGFWVRVGMFCTHACGSCRRPLAAVAAAAFARRSSVSRSGVFPPRCGWCGVTCERSPARSTSTTVRRCRSLQKLFLRGRRRLSGSSLLPRSRSPSRSSCFGVNP